MLPSKTVPSTKRLKLTTRSQQSNNSAATSSKAKSMTHAKKKLRKTTVVEVEDEDSPRNIALRNRAGAVSPEPSAATETTSGISEQSKKVKA